MGLMLGPDGPPPGGPPQGGPPPGGPDAGPPQDGPVSMYTQAAIQALHDAIAHEPDAEDKLNLTKALQTVLQVQAKNAQGDQGGGAPQGAGPGPNAALAGRLGG